MSVAVTCRACGARLKLPPGTTKKKAKCPKCGARVDLTAALDASAYHADSVASLAEVPADAQPARASKPAAVAPAATPTQAAKAKVAAPEDDPLPYPAAAAKVAATAPAKAPTAQKPVEEPPLTLDDDPQPLSLDDDPASSAPAQPAAPPPFRTPALVAADSAGLFTGPCQVVVVPHGMFLESVPYRPFLYAPIRSRVEASGIGFVLTLPDGRALTIEFEGLHAERIAEDTAGFLSGRRSMPDPKEYRRNPTWLLWPALIFAAGPAVGALVLAKTTEVGFKTGALFAAAFAGMGLVANAAAALLTRMSLPAKVVVMATVGVLITGVCFFGAAAYMAGRRYEAELARPEPVPQQQAAVQPTPPPQEVPLPPKNTLPTAADAAYREGVHLFEDGPDDVTSLGVTPDGAVMLVGYKNGETRVWRFDQLTIDPFVAGPRADGPVTRIDFDATGSISYLTCPGGVVAAYWNNLPEVPAKIPGDLIAPFTFPSGERFAAYRGNSVTLRYVPTGLLKKPPPQKAKGPYVLLPKDEVIPADVKALLTAAAQKPTMLAWHPTGKLLGGLPDGSVVSWGATGPRPEVVTRDHKGPIRAWAASPGTWDFATGDDKGNVGLWANKAMIPRVFTGASAAGGGAVAVTHLAFSPAGSLLALTDSANTVWVWDLFTMRSIVRVNRPGPLRALSFGPHDDLLMLGSGKGIECWHLAELAKQP